MDEINNPEMIDLSIHHANNRKEARKTYNRLGFALVIYLAGQLVLPFLAGKLLTLLIPSLEGSALLGMPVVYFCMYLISFPIMLLILKPLPNTSRQVPPLVQDKVNIKQILLLYPLCYTVMNLFSIAATFIESLLGTSSTVTTNDIIAGGVPLWITFILGVFIAPTMEEIIFRHFTYKKAAGFGKIPFVIWSAVMFGLLHLNFGQTLYAGMLGVLLALVMYKTGSVKNTIIIHMLINFSGGIGIGSFFLSSNNPTLIMGYSLFVIVLMVIGIICGIILLLKKYFIIENRTLPENRVKTSAAFLNAGSLLYLLICIAVITLTLVLS